MAGDWIKMRVDLSEDMRVDGIAAATGLDAFAVVGRLHRLWSWADTHTRDGTVTLPSRGGDARKWIDAKVEVDGFAAALEEAGWLSIKPNGFALPNFTEHNGKTGKERALATRRQQNHRAQKSNAPVTPPVTPHRDSSVTRGEESSTNKHLPVAKSTEAPRPVDKPDEGKSRSTPPPRSRSEAKTRQLLEEQRTREVADPPPHVADLASKLKATAPPKHQRIPRGNGEPHEPLADPEWWETPAGIQREGKQRGVQPRPEDQGFPDYAARVFVVAGEGPWMHHLTPQIRERVEHWRVVGVSPS